MAETAPAIVTDTAPFPLAVPTNGTEATNATNGAARASPYATSHEAVVLDPAPVLHLSGGIRIRQMRLADLPDMAAHLNQRHMWLNMSDRITQPYTIEQARLFYDGIMDPANMQATSPVGTQQEHTWDGEKVPTAYVIVDERDEVLGGIGVMFKRDILRRTCTVGYWLKGSCWGKGIMTEAVKALVAWIWATFAQIVRIDGHMYTWNPGSARVLEKCGFELECVSKAAIFKDGKVGDELIYRLIRSEYQ